MRILARGFLRIAMLALATSAAHADELLCNMDTSPALPRPKQIRVVKMGPDGKGDRSEILGFTALRAHNELRVTTGPGGEISELRVAGVQVRMETLLTSGVSMQMGLDGIDKDSSYVWDAIRITARKLGSGYQIFLRTITEAQAWGEDPTRNDAWVLARDDQGRWGIVHDHSGALPRYIDTVTAHLVMRDPKEGKGFKGVSRYSSTPRPLPAIETATTASDPRVNTGADKPVVIAPAGVTPGPNDNASTAGQGS